MNNRFVSRFALLILALVTLACSPCGLLGGRNTSAPTAVPLPTAAPPTEAPTMVTEMSPTPPPTETPPPEAEPPSGWRMYTNNNFVRQIAQTDDGTLWAATSGGAVAWDLASGEATVYTVLDGLPANNLHAVVVCPIPDPRVIFGSDEGLALYDPASGSWERWASQNSSLASNEVAALSCDPESNTLLMVYNWGVGTFDAAAGEWRHLTADDGLASDWANQVLVIDGEIWVTSSSGVSVIHADGSATIYDEETSDIPDERVTAIATDGDGTIWLAGFDGLFKFQGGTWSQYSDDNVEEFPFLDAFEDVVAAPDGTIWLGNGFGEICQFDPTAETCLEIYDSEEGMTNDLNDLLLDDQGTLTYCGDQGITTFDGSSWRTLTFDGHAAGNVYDAITQTPDGTIWVGGYFGLQSFPAADPDGAWDHDEMDGYRVSTFHLGQEGLWIGHGGGATYAGYDQLQQRDAWTPFEAVDEPGQGVYGGVVAITEDGSGRVWFGGSGLTVWDGETYTYYDLLTDEERANGDSPGFAHGLLYDGTGVWVSTWGRLLYFDDNDEVTMWDELPVGGTPYVESMALDADGQVLLADANRLLTYDGGTFAEQAQVDDTVMSIFVGETGEIWLGLEDQGVSHYDGSEWSTMTTADGLPTNRFSDESILVDSLGAVWFAGTVGGLARYVP